MTTRIYLRASTKDQDAQRALNQLDDLNQRLELGESVNRHDLRYMKWHYYFITYRCLPISQTFYSL